MGQWAGGTGAGSFPPPPCPRWAGLFLRADPVLDRGAPVEHFATDPRAGRAKLAGLPAGEGVAGKAEFTGQLLATDPVGQQVEGLVLRGRGCGLHYGLPSRSRQVPETGRGKQTGRTGT
ncbi:MAG: hypothetical protein ACK5QX_09865 [bacterium]